MNVFHWLEDNDWDQCFRRADDSAFWAKGDLEAHFIYESWNLIGVKVLKAELVIYKTNHIPTFIERFK